MIESAIYLVQQQAAENSVGYDYTYLIIFFGIAILSYIAIGIFE